MPIPLWVFHQSMLVIPLSSIVMVLSAANSAAGWLVLDSVELVSVTMICTLGALAPPDWLISERSWLTAPATSDGVVSMFATEEELAPGYQWKTTKSARGARTGSTVWFQSALDPGPTMPSGQKPGVVTTTPILMVGSTAFIAVMNCAALLA